MTFSYDCVVCNYNIWSCTILSIADTINVVAFCVFTNVISVDCVSADFNITGLYFNTWNKTSIMSTCSQTGYIHEVVSNNSITRCTHSGWEVYSKVWTVGYGSDIIAVYAEVGCDSYYSISWTCFFFTAGGGYVEVVFGYGQVFIINQYHSIYVDIFAGRCECVNHCNVVCINQTAWTCNINSLIGRSGSV